MGADVVIGVNPGSDIVGKWRKKADAEKSREAESVLGKYKKTGAIGIFQNRITRSRLAGDPADVMIAPEVSDSGILEFQRARGAMQKGEVAVEQVIDDIHQALERM